MDRAKAAVSRFRMVYRNEFVDFMGGEPTLHPKIYEIVEYAAAIGISPTCITHGMRLADKRVVERFKRAGIHDFLVSIHGIGDRARAIHRRGTKNFDKQHRGLLNLRELRIPVRFNVTMIRDNLDQLSQIALLCEEVGGSVINFLTFNPYFEWGDGREAAFQAPHGEIAPYLREAIDFCNGAGIEANVRYMPICQLKGYERHMFNGFQLPYDAHEWDYNSWYDFGYAGERSEAWYIEAARLQRERHHYRYPAPCQACSLKGICDGFHAQYLARFGTAEAQPYSGPVVVKPTAHIYEQWKLEYTSNWQLTQALGSSVEESCRVALTQFNANLGHRAGINPEDER